LTVLYPFRHNFWAVVCGVLFCKIRCAIEWSESVKWVG
jgi:hypothetical protein